MWANHYKNRAVPRSKQQERKIPLAFRMVPAHGPPRDDPAPGLLVMFDFRDDTKLTLATVLETTFLKKS